MNSIFFKKNKKGMWTLREVIVLVFAAVLIVIMIAVYLKLKAATSGDKHYDSIANFDRLYNKIEELINSDDNDDGKILNPKQKYINNSGFSSTLVNDKVSIKTNEMDIEIESGRGVYNLSKKGGGKNYHTDNKCSEFDTSFISNDTFFSDEVSKSLNATGSLQQGD